MMEHVTQMHRSMRSFLTLHHCTDTTVLAGVSGGLDSVALLDIAHAVRHDCAMDLHVVHVDHGLRGEESRGDASFVEDVCHALGIPFHLRKVDPASFYDDANGPEDAARRARYEAFDDVARSIGAQRILLAHTADDVAETLLMHLARGSGITGLAGIPPMRVMPSGLTVLRPLIDVTRTALEEYVHARNLAWRTDSSNDEDHFLRNRLRHHVMPAVRSVLGTDVTTAMARSAGLLREARSIVMDAVQPIAREATIVDGTTAGLRLDVLRRCSTALRAEVLRYVLRRVVPGHPPDRDGTERIMTLVDAETGSRASIGRNLVALRERDTILFVEDDTAGRPIHVAIVPGGTYVVGSRTLRVDMVPASEIRLSPDPSEAYLDADTVRGDLAWRTWQDGDRFRPLGLDGTALVSDMLTNARIPHSRRSLQTVVCDREGILWIVGLRISDLHKVSSTTTRILRLAIA